MANENVVIAYLADISDIKRNVTQISTINKQLAIKMGADFSKGFSVISSELKKIELNKKLKIKVEGQKGLKTVRQNVSTFEKVVRTADGQLFKFTETFRKGSKGAVLLSSSINKVAVAQKKLSSVTSQTSTKFSSLTNINSTFSKQLRSIGQVSKFVGTSLNQLSDNGSKVSKIFQTTNGKFVQLTQTTKRLPSGVNQVTRSIKQLSKAQAQNARTIEGNNRPTKNFAQNLKSLAGRALLTIPVWFALRSAISGVFRTIRDGLKNLGEFDRALQKLSRNLEATSTNLASDFSKVQKVITDFSLKTGKSTEEITNAIQKFATVGFDLETSIAGGLNATKLAITLFGDGEETAQAFARSMRVLTEDMTDSTQVSLEIAKAMALTDKLWQTNAFEVNEFSGNLTKFAGTAKIANLSIQETLALLATLSTAGLGDRAGRLLRSTLLRALADIPKFVKGLDLDFDPDTQPTILFITKLVAKLKELQTTRNIPAELASVLGELFTVRSTEVVAGLVALERTLKENLALKPDLEEFNKTFENQLVQVNRLIERHKNLNKEMGKAFVTGLIGAGNYKKALTGLVSVQEKLIDDTELLGTRIRNTFLIVGVGAIAGFSTKLKGLLLLLKTPIAIGILLAITASEIATKSEQLRKDIEKNLKFTTNIGANLADQINKGIKGKLDVRSLKALVFVLENLTEEAGKDLGISSGSIEGLLKTLKEIVIVQREIATEQKEATSEAEKSLIVEKNRKKIAEIVLTNQLEILKARGALESALLKADQIIRKSFGIEKEGLELLKDKLATERAINDEKRLENETISDTSQKLAEIARTEGLDVARRIGDVLNRDIDFDLFERIGGKPLETFKKQFGDIFQQQKDIQFLNQKGFGITLDQKDTGIIRGNKADFRFRDAVSAEQRRSEQFIKNLNVASTVNTNALTDNTFTIKELITNFQKGVPILGLDAQRVLDFFTNNPLVLNPQPQPVLTTATPTGVIPSTRSILDITVNVDGKNLQFTGSPEAIRQLATQVGENVAQAVEDKLVNDLNNNNSSPISEATDGRINQF